MTDFHNAASASSTSLALPQDIPALSRKYWMKDSSSNECYSCSSKFNWRKRKHHCRICGLIFCWNCSFIKRGLRICHNCSSVLENRRKKEGEELLTANHGLMSTENLLSDRAPFGNVKVDDDEYYEAELSSESEDETPSSSVPRSNSLRRYRNRKSIQLNSFLLQRKVFSSLPPSTEVELNKFSLQHAQQMLNQLLNDENITTKWTSVLFPILLKITSSISQNIQAGDEWDIRKYIKIKRIESGKMEDSRLVDGYMFKKNLAQKQMKRSIDNPNIVCVAFPLEYHRTDDSLMSLDPVIAQEEEYLQNLINRIKSLDPQLLLVEKNVSGLALRYLAEAGISVAVNIKSSIIAAIPRYTGADIISSIDRLVLSPKVGTCESFKMVTFLDSQMIKRNYIILDGCIKGAGCTVMLRGANKDVLAKIKRILKLMILSVYNLKLETNLLTDEFGSIPTNVRESTPPSFDVINRASTNEKYRTFFSFMKNRISSISPLVTFPPPTLLAQLAHQESQISLLGKETHTSLPQEEALFSFDRQIKEWTTNYGHEMEKTATPFAHLNFLLLYYNACRASNNPCQGPEIRVLEFYSEGDCTLGQYVEELSTSANNLCSGEKCGHKLLDHVHSYSHGRANVRVDLEAMDCPIPGMRNTILMWSYCKICQKSTPVVPVSESSWKYSFGKYLELSVYNDNVTPRASICPHRLHRDHIRCFSFQDICVKFKVEPIRVLKVVQPPLHLLSDSRVIRRLRKEELISIQLKIDRYWDSVRNRLITAESVKKQGEREVSDIDFASWLRRAADQHFAFSKSLRDIHVISDELSITCYNSVIRNLQEVVAQWDIELGELDKLFFPSEKELGRLAAQLKKFFEREGASEPSTETSTKAESASQAASISPPKPATPTFPDEHNEKQDSPLKPLTQIETTNSQQKPPENERVAADKEPTEIKSSEPSIHEEASHTSAAPEDKSVTDIKTKGKVSKSPEPEIVPPLKHYKLNHTNSSSSVTTQSTAASRARQKSKVGTNNTRNFSLDPRLIKLARQVDGRVSTLSRHFEDLSKEIEKQKERLKFQRDNPKRRRARPVISSKPMVEVFSSVKDAVGDLSDDDTGKEPEESSKENEIDYKAEKRKSNSGNKSDSATEAEKKSTASTISKRLVLEMQQATSQMSEQIHQNNSLLDKEFRLTDTITDTDLERSSFMKVLSVVWADRLVPLYFNLNYPLQNTEHVFADSDYIIREDEPSSIIAFTLNTPDYKGKILEMMQAPQESLTKKPSSDDTHSLEGSLLRKENSHLRYQFQEGNTTFFCKVFYSEQFDALRNVCHCQHTFLQSLARCIKWDSSGGKSKSAFLKTLDNRFVIKQMSRYEIDAFLKFAPEYFEHMAGVMFQGTLSALAKILGVFQIGFKNSSGSKSFKMDVLVMENIFYNRKISKIFDLKGSMRNRHVHSTGKEEQVLLDENLHECMLDSPLFVQEYAKTLLKTSLHNDTFFLSRLNVMDYSLIVGVDSEKEDLVIGVIDFIRTFTWDKRIESWVKERGLIGGGVKEPTVVTPKLYKYRFRKAMDQYIMMVVDAWPLNIIF